METFKGHKFWTGAVVAVFAWELLLRSWVMGAISHKNGV